MDPVHLKNARAEDFNHYLEILREKWVEIPATQQDRTFSTDLQRMSDEELVAYWQSCFRDHTMGTGWSIRGWYHQLYAELMRSGASILDVGSGFGLSTIYFAQLGAKVTFMDIVQDNLNLLARICTCLGIPDVDFIYLENLNTIETLNQSFDVITALGSLINSPYEITRFERQALVQKLKIGGRWLELAYPKQRWIREGELPFSEWGRKTDGERTPWVEWYDLDKILASLEPAKFNVVLSLNFHNDDFNWFDLVRIS